MVWVYLLQRSHQVSMFALHHFLILHLSCAHTCKHAHTHTLTTRTHIHTHTHTYPYHSHTHTHTHTHIPLPLAHTYTHAHTHTLTTRTHIHTRTHTQVRICPCVPWWAEWHGSPDWQVPDSRLSWWARLWDNDTEPQRGSRVDPLSLGVSGAT